ncbi:hypothetical protein D0T50_08040 [Bacteroides sp. 214]|nr:hypothetical protein [Bacteroides sp. 214]
MTLPYISVKAQEREPELKVTSAWEGVGESKTLNIKATLLKPGIYSILFNFTELNNIMQAPQELRVVKGTGIIFTLRGTDPQERFGCKYNCYYALGYESSRMDSNFVYRLPYSTHRTEPVRGQSNYVIGKHVLGGGIVSDRIDINFHLEQGDTIFAMRKGEVVRVKNESTKIYSLTILQGDGTVCTYSVFNKGEFLVKEGDVVYPGTPLRINENEAQRNENYLLRVNVYYPVVNPDFGEKKRAIAFLQHHYNPVFATDKGNMKIEGHMELRATSTPELIQKEMTKKEKKRTK